MVINMDNNAKCIRCGNTLVLINDMSFDEAINDSDFDEASLKQYNCPYCGIDYEIGIHGEEYRNRYHHYNKDVNCDVSDENHGYEGRCPNCGHYVIIMNNFMRSEICGDVDEDDVDENGIAKDDTICDILFCPNCGADITVIPPKPSEEENYDWYKEVKTD